MEKSMFLLSFFITNISMAQLDQGSHQLGGTLQLISTSRNDAVINGTSIDAIPDYGLFVADRLLIGSGLGIQYSQNKIDADNQDRHSKTTSFIINPFARYHFILSDNFFLFTQADFTLMPGKNRREEVVGNEPIVSKSNVLRYSAGISPGFLFLLSDHFGMEAGIGFIGFSSQAQKGEDADSWINQYRSFSFDFSPDNINLGLRYYF